MRTFNDEHLFEPGKDKDYHNPDRITHFNLHMICLKSTDDLRDIKITIDNLPPINSTFGLENKYIVAPLYIWINNKDTLEYIVSQYLKKARKYISLIVIKMELVMIKRSQYQKVNGMDMFINLSVK